LHVTVDQHDHQYIIAYFLQILCFNFSYPAIFMFCLGLVSKFTISPHMIDSSDLYYNVTPIVPRSKFHSALYFPINDNYALLS